MANPERVWLSPECDNDAHHGDGRTWASPAPEAACEDCGSPWVEYVRSDLATRTPAPPTEVVEEAPSIKVERTSRGFAVARGSDCYGRPWSVQDSSLATKECIWLGSDALDSGRAHLTRDAVAALIPLLRRFVESGSIAALSHPEPTRG